MKTKITNNVLFQCIKDSEVYSVHMINGNNVFRFTIPFKDYLPAMDFIANTKASGCVALEHWTKIED